MPTNNAITIRTYAVPYHPGQFSSTNPAQRTFDPPVIGDLDRRTAHCKWPFRRFVDLLARSMERLSVQPEPHLLVPGAG